MSDEEFDRGGFHEQRKLQELKTKNQLAPYMMHDQYF
jgi:hypothetical protein